MKPLHAIDQIPVDTDAGEREKQIVALLFSRIPVDRMFGALSGLREMQFVGGLKFALEQFGRPAMMHILMQQEENGPEWRAIFRADFPKYGVLFGPYDPSAFIYMWNYRQTTIDGIDVALHCNVDETVFLNNALQPETMRLEEDIFVTNAIFPVVKEETKLPGFMKMNR